MPVFNYDLTDYDGDNNFGGKKTFEPLKPGTYQAMVIATKVKRTKKDNGEFVELEFQIIDGPSAGRRHWERYNLENPNKKTEAMAARQLGWVCNAVGFKIKDMKTTEQLHDIPVNLVLDIDFKDPTKNRITECHPISSAQKPPQSSTKKPWERS
jgi:hypothetical protein